MSWVSAMEIKKAALNEAQIIAELAIQMWNSHTIEELKLDFEGYMQSGGAVFLAWNSDEAVGFAQCGLRHDYVEGTDSSPVGYLEGVFVTSEYQRQGIAKMLLMACECWVKEQGCVEFASDCELTNEESLRFHLNMGFEEANRIICFTKRL